MDQPPTRLFTVEEANALLPELRRILQDLREAREAQAEAQQQLAERYHGGQRTNGHVNPGGEVERLTEATEQAQRRMTEAVQAIHRLGGELKDVERGMVDFRTLRDGRVVYLCWLMHEPSVLFWHELEGGYRGRQPLE